MERELTPAHNFYKQTTNQFCEGPHLIQRVLYIFIYLIFLFLQIVVVPGSDKKIEPLIWLEECQKSIHFQMCREFQEISWFLTQERVFKWS